MFWSANYTSVRQLNILLQKENVTLSQVLEADDILQECKADNTALIKFLTRPDILAELITLITEEPPNNVELTSQYRHANIACEVLTSHLSKLSDCLSSNTEQMNRLCDFLNRDPPLNPLLASYFSKTVEMLLDRNPKQDWYLYHIVCLRVIDFFKSRPDFLHNLLRHMSTSAIADVFKYFIRLDLFSKNIIEWLEQNQFIESLIQIICCLYTPEELPIVTQSVNSGRDAEHIDKAEQENNEKSETLNHNHAAVDNKLTSTNINSIEENNTQDHLNHQKVDSESNPEVNSDGSRDDIHKTESVVKQEINESLSEEELQRQRVVRLQRMQAVASANAASLLCDIVETGCITNGGSRSGLSWCVVGALCSAQCAGALLQGMATSGRRAALVGGARLLRALLQHAEPALQAALPAALAPHLPLLHRALLRERAEQRRGAGEARIQLCALLAALHACTHADVVHTLLTLGTAGAAAALLARFPRCSLLHREVAALLLHALHHPQPHYKRQLLVEHDLLTLLMDLYEENETKEKPRAAYMGHVVQLLRHLQELLPAAPAPDTAPAPDAGPASEAPAAPAPDYAPASVPDAAPAPAPAPAPNAGPVSEAPAAPDAAPAPAPEAQLLAPHVAARWAAFQRDKLQPLAQLMDTPLGGSIPMDAKFQTLEDFLDEEEEKDRALEQQQTAQQQQLDEDLEQPTPATEYFLQLAAQRYHDDFSMWDDEPSADLVLPAETPWDSSPPAEVEAGWAQFPVAAPAAPPPPPPPRPQHPDEQFSPFWTYGEDQNGGAALEAALQQLQVSRLEASTRELTHNLLAAMSSMSPAALATLVHHDAWGPAEPTPADLTATRAEPSATDSEPGATDSEPSANPAEPSATNSEPSATNFEASATNSELSATNSEPNATNSEPSVTNSEPSATNFEPSATNSEPSVTNSEPSATNFEPSATNSEPSATNFDPSATNSEPSVTNSEDSDR